MHFLYFMAQFVPAVIILDFDTILYLTPFTTLDSYVLGAVRLLTHPTHTHTGAVVQLLVVSLLLPFVKLLARAQRSGTTKQLQQLSNHCLT